MNVGHVLLHLQRTRALVRHHTMPGEGGIHLISSFAAAPNCDHASPMTEVYSLKFDKALFDAAPARQRAAYLMASQLWNDVNILSRQMLICQTPANSDCSHAEKSARLAAQILYLRLPAGRLHEGQSFYTSLKSVLPSWKADLPDQAVSAIKSLNAYFNRNNSTITRLRKKIGFHADFDMFEESLSYIAGPISTNSSATRRQIRY